MDCIEHTFNIGNLAAKVWRSFAACAGMQPHNSALQILLQQWWTVMPKNAAHKSLMQATPILFVGSYGRTGVQPNIEAKYLTSAG